MTSMIERKRLGQVRFLRLPEVLACTGLSRSTSTCGWSKGASPGRSRWDRAPWAGSRPRWTNGCASGSQRAAATRSEDITGRAVSDGRAGEIE